LVAVVDKAESEVVVLVGVPGISEGVSKFDGGGGRLISIGWEACDVCGVAGAVDDCCDIAPGFGCDFE